MAEALYKNNLDEGMYGEPKFTEGQLQVFPGHIRLKLTTNEYYGPECEAELKCVNFCGHNHALGTKAKGNVKQNDV